MNVDEAMAEVETTIRRNPRLFSSHYYEVASVLAKEVERLRAELARCQSGERVSGSGGLLRTRLRADGNGSAVVKCRRTTICRLAQRPD